MRETSQMRFLASFSNQFDEVAWCIFIQGVSFYVETYYTNIWKVS